MDELIKNKTRVLGRPIEEFAEIVGMTTMLSDNQVEKLIEILQKRLEEGRNKDGR